MSKTLAVKREIGYKNPHFVMSTPVSIYDLPPLETGGQVARQGFAFQDHVAASFLIKMLKEPSICEVWCETQDDITLILQHDKTGLCVEFVQVKGAEINQLWSIAKLCERDGRTGSSIVENSMAYDRCKEPCTFRVVTARPVQADLRILTLDRDGAHRTSNGSELDVLANQMESKLGEIRSPNGHGCRSWVERTLLQFDHSIETVTAINLNTLRIVAERLAVTLFHDQLEELYAQLVALASNAGRQPYEQGAQHKRITKQFLIDWMEETVRKTGQRVQPGKAMRKKMENASIADDQILSAASAREFFRHERLTPRYRNAEDYALVENEVLATLHTLKAALDAGSLPDDGPTFHHTCLARLEDLRTKWPINQQPPAAFIQGCMYEMTDRCTHRFRRATA